MKLLVFKLTILTFLLLSFNGCKTFTSSKNVELIKAIPNHVAFIVKTNNIQRLDSTLINLPYKNVLEAYSWLNTLKNNHQSLSSVLSKVAGADSNYIFPMVASLHLSNASELNSIHYFPLNISKKSFEKLLEEHFPGTSKHQWQYQNTTITEILISDLERKVTLAFEGNILVTSPVSFLVEDAIKQINNGNGLLSDNSFNKVYNKESNDADLNLWFKYENMKKWVSTFSNTTGTKTLSSFSNFAEWMLMDVYFNEDDIFMSGITSTKNSNTLSQFSEQSKCNHSNGAILPFNTAVKAHYSQIPDSLKNFTNQANANGCWTKILMEPLNASDINNWVLAFKLNSDEQASNENIVAIENLGSKLLGTFEVSSKQYQNYQLVAKDKSTLQNYYNSISSNQVLSKDKSYTALAKNLKSDANVNFYVRSAYTKEAFKAIYKNESNVSTDFDALRGFNQIAFQFSKDGEKYLTSAHFTFADHDISGHTNVVWNTKLDKDVVAGPQIVSINQKGDKAVLVQDGDFKMYLIGPGGNTIWTKQLKSQWLGEAHYLQLYNDNSSQLTFNTQLNWYLIDEDANDIVGFPLKFKDDANTGLSIAKINGKNCAFIGLSNQNVYAYEINGKPLKGWNPQNNVGTLVQGLQTIKSNGKAYISALNTSGKVFIWDTNGKLVKSSSFNTKFPSQPFVDLKAKPFKLKNVKSNGELVSLNAKGSVGKFKLPISKVSQFMMSNITGNSDPEIIVSNGDRITVFSYTGKKLWTKNAKGKMSLINQKGSSKSVLSVIDKKKHTITILNAKGKIISQPNFYVGSDNCTGNLLGNDQIALVSNGQSNEVICYRIALE